MQPVGLSKASLVFLILCYRNVVQYLTCPSPVWPDITETFYLIRFLTTNLAGVIYKVHMGSFINHVEVPIQFSPEQFSLDGSVWVSSGPIIQSQIIQFQIIQLIQSQINSVPDNSVLNIQSQFDSVKIIQSPSNSVPKNSVLVKGVVFYLIICKM